MSEIKANGLKGNALTIAFSNRSPQLIYLPQDQWGTVEKPRQFEAAAQLNPAGTMAIQRAMQNFESALAEVKPPGPSPLDVSLHAEPTSVEKGRPVALVWTSSNATSLDLEPGVGRVAAAGGISLVPARLHELHPDRHRPGGDEGSQRFRYRDATCTSSCPRLF